MGEASEDGVVGYEARSRGKEYIMTFEVAWLNRDEYGQQQQQQ
jgi:hypothetical protein